MKTFLFISLITLCFACGNRSIKSSSTFVSDSVTIIQIDQDTVWAKQPNSNWYKHLEDSLQLKYIRKQLVHLVQQHPKKVIYAIQLDTSFYPRFSPQPEIVIAINPRLSRETYLDNEDTTLGDSIITIRYRQLVNGYNVTMKWSPNKEILERGIAHLTFSNSESNFTIKTDYYWDPNFCDRDSLRNKKELNLDYTNPEDTFYFRDVDFDGYKELIVVKFRAGPYGVHLWRIFKIIEGKVIPMDYPPFDGLGSESKFYLTTRIIKNVYGAANSGTVEKWEKQSNGKFQLIYQAYWSDFNSYDITAIDIRTLRAELFQYN